MTKKEIIQEAYGEHWETIKNYVDKNGWLDLSIAISKNIGEIGSKTYQFKGLEKGNHKYCRILALSEIEENKGWIKINSEDDLPKEDMECFYILEIPQRYSNAGKKINIGSFKFGKNIMSQQENYFTMDNFFYHRFPSVTHYQPIIKPNEPLY